MRTMLRAARLALAPLAALALLAPEARADDFDEPGSLSDQVSVLAFDKEVLAVDARTGAPIGQRLRLNEDALRIHSQGLLAVVETQIRLFGFSARTRNWSEKALRLNESAPLDVRTSDRLALVVTDKQVHLFDGRTGVWTSGNIPPNETVLRAGVGLNVAAAVTKYRAMAYSAVTGGFFVQSLFKAQPSPELAVGDNTVTVVDTGRILTFVSGANRWASTSRIRLD